MEVHEMSLADLIVELGLRLKALGNNLHTDSPKKEELQREPLWTLDETQIEEMIDARH